MRTALPNLPLTNATGRWCGVFWRPGFCAKSPSMPPVVAGVVAWQHFGTTTATFRPSIAKAEAMATAGVVVSSDFVAYLRDEAERRECDIAVVYQEEMIARNELARITPQNADLLRLAEQFPAPQEWYDE